MNGSQKGDLISRKCVSPKGVFETHTLLVLNQLTDKVRKNGKKRDQYRQMYDGTSRDEIHRQLPFKRTPIEQPTYVEFPNKKLDNKGDK